MADPVQSAPRLPHGRFDKMTCLVMSAFRFVSCVLCASLLMALCIPLQAQRKKKDEEVTQTLEVLPDPPTSVVTTASRLSFFTTPLSNKGLFSKQTSDALKVLLSQSKKSNVVKIRALCAGNGDLRRVPQLVSEAFTEKRKPLPVITVVQVGSLPLDGAQIQLEAIIEEKTDVNPAGLLFLAAEPPPSGTATAGPVPELLTGALRQLDQRAKSTSEAKLIQATCYVSSIDDPSALTGVLARALPGTPVTLAQLTRSPESPLAACEGFARLTAAPSSIDQSATDPAMASPAIVGPGRVILTGSQLAFSYKESDARLAFDRLNRTLEGSRSSLKQAVVLNAYPLSAQLAAMVRRVRADYLDSSRPPAGTLLVFQGLPSMDASFSLEAIAPAPDTGAPSKP